MTTSTHHLLIDLVEKALRFLLCRITRHALIPASDVAAFNLFRKILHHLRHLLEMRVDGKGTAEHFQRVAVVTRNHEKHAKTHQSTEMARLAAEHFLNIF